MSERISFGVSAKNMLVDKGMALSLAATLALGFFGQAVVAPAAMAQAEALPLRKIGVDANKMLVFEFATGGAKPAQPVVRELTAGSHRLVFDFPGAAFDSQSMPSAEELSNQISAVLPGVIKARYSMVKNAKVPTARLVLDIAQTVKVEPRLVRHEEGAVTLSLGEELASTPAAAADTSPSTTISDQAPAQNTQSVADLANAAKAEVQEAPQAAPQSEKPTQVADSYDVYMKAFQAQREENKKEAGEWGPRKGSIRELKGGKPEVIPLVTTTALDRKLMEAAPAETKAQPNAFAEAEANRAKAQTEAPAPAEQAAADTHKNAGGWDVAESKSDDANANPKKKVEAVEPVSKEPALRESNSNTAENVSETSSAETANAAQGAASAPVPATASAKEPEPANMESEGQGESSVSDNMDEPAQVKARRLFNNAVKAHLSGQLAEAIAGYKSALELDNGLADAHSNLGLAYNQQHNYASAISELRKALAVNPSDAITYNGIGAALLAEKDIPGAVKNWETAVKLDPRLAVAHYNLGTAYEAQGDFDRALISYENAIRNDSRLGEAYYRIGLIMQRKHRIEEARDHYKKALKVSDSSDYSADAKQRLASLDHKVK